MKSKTFLFVAMFIFASATTLAQSEQVHKIEKGETVESIAQKYGVTVDDIKKANPNAESYFYTGMTIKIPTKVTTTQEVENVPTTTENQQTSQPQKTNWLTTKLPSFKTDVPDFQAKTTQHNTTSATTPDAFDFIGVEYISSFEDISSGGYYLNWQVFGDSGWGGEFGLGANYGLIDSDFAGIFHRIGVAYGHVISESVMLSVSFGFDGSYHGMGTYTEKGISNSNASWGGYPYEVTRSHDNEYDWGLSLKPQLIFKAGAVKPHIGLTFSWAEGSDEINIGFAIGLGFNI